MTVSQKAFVGKATVVLGVLLAACYVTAYVQVHPYVRFEQKQREKLKQLLLSKGIPEGDRVALAQLLYEDSTFERQVDLHVEQIRAARQVRETELGDLHGPIAWITSLGAFLGAFASPNRVLGLRDFWPGATQVVVLIVSGIALLRVVHHRAISLLKDTIGADAVRPAAKGCIAWTCLCGARNRNSESSCQQCERDREKTIETYSRKAILRQIPRDGNPRNYARTAFALGLSSATSIVASMLFLSEGAQFAPARLVVTDSSGFYAPPFGVILLITHHGAIVGSILGLVSALHSFRCREPARGLAMIGAVASLLVAVAYGCHALYFTAL